MGDTHRAENVAVRADASMHQVGHDDFRNYDPEADRHDRPRYLPPLGPSALAVTIRRGHTPCSFLAGIPRPSERRKVRAPARRPSKGSGVPHRDRATPTAPTRNVGSALLFRSSDNPVVRGKFFRTPVPRRCGRQGVGPPPLDLTRDRGQPSQHSHKSIKGLFRSSGTSPAVNTSHGYGWTAAGGRVAAASPHSNVARPAWQPGDLVRTASPMIRAM